MSNVHRTRSTTSGGWTPWGDRLLAALSIALVIGLAGAWIMQYANPQGNAFLVERLSYPIVDPSWMPPGVTHPYPLIGVHYFGDMWYHIGFGEAQSPYIIAGRPAQYPPIAILFFKAWGLFGYPAALAIMTFLNIALVSAFAWTLTAPSPRSKRILIISLTALLTTPMLVTLDRGGHQYIALGFLAWALWLYKRGHTIWSVLLAVIAISLKSYFVFFLIYPLVRGHKRFAIEVTGLTIALNAILFLAFPGRVTVSFAGFLTSSSQFSNGANFDNIFNGTSLTSLLFHLAELSQGTETATSYFTQFERFLSIPGLLWMVLVAILAASRRVPYWASIALALSTSAMAIPAAWPYNFASASLAALYFGTRGQDPFPMGTRSVLDRIKPLAGASRPGRIQTHLLRIVIGLTILAALAPQFMMLSGSFSSEVRGYYVLAPLVTLLGGAAALVWLFLPRRPTINQSPS